MNSNFEM